MAGMSVSGVPFLMCKRKPNENLRQTIYFSLKQENLHRDLQILRIHSQMLLSDPLEIRLEEGYEYSRMYDLSLQEADELLPKYICTENIFCLPVFAPDDLHGRICFALSRFSPSLTNKSWLIFAMA